MSERLLSVREVLLRLGIARSSFYAILGRGDGPPVVKIGARTLVREGALDDWMRSRERNAA